MRKLKTLLIAVMSLVAMAMTAQTKTAYAVYCEKFETGTLYFLNSSETLTEGGTFTIDGEQQTITKLWSGEDVTNSDIVSTEWSTYFQQNFEKCQALKSVVIDESFKDVKPKSFGYWFYLLSKLQSIEGLENLDTSEATNMNCMFNNCRALTELDLSSFDTGKVEDMTNMFLSCTSLKKLDLSSFNTSNVKRMGSMFNGCEALTELDLSSFDTRNVMQMISMFAYCKALTYIDKSDDFGANATTTGMYTGCNPLLQGSTPYVVYNKADRSLHFLCNADADLTAITLGDGTEITLTGNNHWKGDDVVNIAEYTNPGWIVNASSSGKVVFEESFKFARPTNCNSWFSSGAQISEITGLENLYTSKVTDMSNMFSNCPVLTELDLSNFDTKNVTDMSAMFMNCEKLQSLTFGDKFTAAKVIQMGDMFGKCSALTKLDLSSFNIGKTTSMDQMFNGCTALTDLDIRNFYISSDMSGNITSCGKLMKLNMSNATGAVMLLTNDNALNGRGIMIIVPDDFEISNDVSTENYIVKTTGTSFARAFTVGNMSTICLPFAVDATAIAEQGTLYKYAGMNTENNAVKFTAVTGETTPGEAYLFKPATGDKVFFAGTDAMTDLPAEITEGTGAGLYGTYTGKKFSDVEATAGIYFGWANGSFWRAGENAEVKHNRAYLKTAAGTTPARLSVKLDDETTGISDVNTPADDDNAPAYDLMGRRVGAGYKGIVIKNGRKGPHPASPKGR